MKSSRWVTSYVIAASVGLWMAFFLSLKFVVPAHSQAKPEAPSSGDLPPEFSGESQKQLPSGAIPPPPSQPPAIPSSEAEAALSKAPPAAQPNQAPAMAPPNPDPLMEMQPAAPAPQFASDEQYTYDPRERRDPFKPYRIFKPAPVVGSGPSATQQSTVDLSDPLQRWDLGRFNVVAIMWEVRSPKAMVKDPDGRLFMIGKSTKIGRNGGHVVTIREGEVVVVETIENEGVVAKEVKVLELKK